jgi:predicted aspartyl protease
VKPHYLFSVCCLTSTLLFGQDHQIPLTESEGGTFYLDSTVSGTDSHMLFDTGSKYVVLGKTTFRELKQTHNMVPIRTIHAVMANGRGSYYPVYQLDQLEFSDNCVFFNVEVVVMEGSNRDILGLNVIKEMTPLELHVYPLPFIVTTECGRDLTVDRSVDYVRTAPVRKSGKHNHEQR